MARTAATNLTEAEHRIMSVLWERRECSVQDITDALSERHSLAYTTVLTTIRIMADKGYVTHRKEGRAHIFRPLVTRDRARRKALRTLLGSLFDGSPRSLAQHLVDEDKLTLEDIEALRQHIVRRRSGKEEG